MKVLQVVNDFFPEPGGVQRTVLELSKALMQMGADVEVLTATNVAGARSRRVEGVRVIYAGHRLRLSQTYLSFSFLRYLATHDADIVHTHIPYPWSADWATLVSTLRGIPVVLTYHNDIVGFGWRGALSRLYNRAGLPLTLRLARSVVTVTPERLLRSPVLRSVSQKVTCVPLGVDSQRFRPFKSPDLHGVVLGFLSLLRESHRHKGLNVLIDALVLLQRKGLKVRLKVGGDGPLLPYYRSRVASLGLGDTVEFAGPIPEAALVDFYNSLTVFVLPSVDHRLEGFGLVAMEAAACGRPVVTTNAAGIAPMLEGVGGAVVVPPGDASALAEAIEQLIRNPRLLSEMGVQGRRFAERHSWDQVAHRYRQLYADLLPDYSE